MGQFSKLVIKRLDEWAGIVYNGSMKTTNNVKSLGVPSEVHAKAKRLADLYNLRMWQVIDRSLDSYALLKSINNGADKDGQS